MSVVAAESGRTRVAVVAPTVSAVEVVRSVLASGQQEDPFFVVDLGRLVAQYRRWTQELPSVQPFYAVKCNDDSMLLSVLAGLGVGFDCASKEEMRKVLALGVSPDRIIYAHPCKQTSHIRFAASVDVRKMTFDNEIELVKMSQAHPRGQLVLRLRADDPSALCNLGCKFGATLPEARQLLGQAQAMGLDVVGISFHIGSGSGDATAYSRAIEAASQLFQHAASLGMQLTLLDIGGGFPGDSDSSELFAEMSGCIREALSKFFGSMDGLEVISEPGRFFAASTHTLAVCVTSKKVEEELIPQEKTKEDLILREKVESELERPGKVEEDRVAEPEKTFKYYVNDGVYGSFNCIIFDHAQPRPRCLQPRGEKTYRCSIWGPTCDGLDQITDEGVLPEVDVGDWLYFEDLGAYSVSSASTFNGFGKPSSFYYTTSPAVLSELPAGDLIGQETAKMEGIVLDHIYQPRCGQVIS